MGTTVQDRVEPIRMHVAGRVFSTATKTTFKQDLYLWEALSSANLDNLIEHFDELRNNLTNMGKQVILQAWSSGALFRVLGGVLIEEGVKWTPEAAENNAVFFEELTDPADKEAIRGQMIEVVLHFFVSEAGLRAISQKSLRDNADAQLPFGADSGEPAISESGTTSSESLPETIH